MAELAAVGTAIAAGIGEVGIGTALTVGSTIAGGVAANEAGKSQAKALRQKAEFDEAQGKQKAGEIMANATRKAQAQRDHNEKVIGRNKALLADSGAGGGEGAKTLEDILYGEADYNLRSITGAGLANSYGAIDDGAMKAHNSRVAANNAEAGGKAALMKAGLGAAGTVVGNKYKIGGLFSADDDLETTLYNDGWETTARRTRRG